MKNQIKLVILCSFVVCMMNSCKKETLQDIAPKSNVAKPIVNQKLIPNPTSDFKRKLDEYACITSDTHEAGTTCISGGGGTCSIFTPCQPIGLQYPNKPHEELMEIWNKLPSESDIK